MKWNVMIWKYFAWSVKFHRKSLLMFSIRAEQKLVTNDLLFFLWLIDMALCQKDFFSSPSRLRRALFGKATDWNIDLHGSLWLELGSLSRFLKWIVHVYESSNRIASNCTLSKICVRVFRNTRTELSKPYYNVYYSVFRNHQEWNRAAIFSTF